MGNIQPPATTTPASPGPSSAPSTDQTTLLQQILANVEGIKLNSQVFVLTSKTGGTYQAVYDGTSQGVGIRYVRKAIFQNLNSATSQTIVTGSSSATEYIGWVLNPQAATNQAGGSVPIGNGKDFIDLSSFYWDSHTTSDQMSVYCEW